MQLKSVFYTLFIIGALSKPFVVSAQSQQEIENYIEQFKELAMQEQIRSGVPAAITLAQGIHESTAGQSELATAANNHFGIKCKSTWTGATYLHDDDAKQECFRKYPSAVHSYKDHSDFLKNSNRYHFLFDLDVTDYQGWASGLKRAGYATNPAYTKRLTDIIEKYNLQTYSTQAQQMKYSTAAVGEVIPENDRQYAKSISEKTSATPPAIQSAPQENYYKGLKGFAAKKGDVLLEKAVLFNIRYARLLQLNDMEDAPVPADMFIFTERKRKVGTTEFHTVSADENMFIISQREAMLLDQLYVFNNLKDGQEPEVGEKLNLQYRALNTPKIKPRFLDAIATTQSKTETDAQETVVLKTQEEVINVNTAVKETENTVADTQNKDYIETPVVENKSASTPVIESKTTENEEVLTSDELAKLTRMEAESSTPTLTNNTIIQTPPTSELPTSTKVIDKSSPIKDLDKAKKVEALLSTDQRVEQDVVMKEIPAVASTTSNTTTNIPITNSNNTEPTQTPVIIKKAPVRTYNEPNVQDDVKALKKRFDEIVYLPLPERKIIEKTQTGIIRDTSAKIVTTQPVKSKPIATNTPVGTHQVQKTNTGIVRQNNANTIAKNSAGKKKDMAKASVNKDKKNVAEKTSKTANNQQKKKEENRTTKTDQKKKSTTKEDKKNDSKQPQKTTASKKK